MAAQGASQGQDQAVNGNTTTALSPKQSRTPQGKRKRSDEALSKKEEQHARSRLSASELIEKEQSLRPTKEQSIKLAAIVRMLDKHGLAKEVLPDEAGVPSFIEALLPPTQVNTTDELEGWPHSFSTLEFYLDLAASSIKRRCHAREGKAKASQSDSTVVITSPSVSSLLSIKEIEECVDAIKSLFEELKDEAAKAQSFTRQKKRKARYALHRTIGSIDLFTSAADLSGEEERLEQLRDTDVLEIHSSATPHLDKITRIGDINPNVPYVRIPNFTTNAEPVTFLYYDPYASFAPTYDSSTATLSYTQSVRVRNSRQEVKSWEKKPLPELPPLSVAGPIKPAINHALTEAIDPALLENSLDSASFTEDDVKQAISEIEDSAVVNSRLQENVALLRLLQEAQWEKLRNQESAKARAAATPLENDAANRVAETLKSLINARPRLQGAYDTFTDSNPLLPLSHEQFARMKASILHAESTHISGTLDQTNMKAIKETILTTSPGAQKNSSQSSKKGSGSHKKDSKIYSGQAGKTHASNTIAIADIPVTL